MQITSLVIVITLSFPILLVQCIHCLIQYVVRKAGANGLSRYAKYVFDIYALGLLLTLVALPVLMGLILPEVIEGLTLSEERPDAVWMPKLMSLYCLSTFWGLSTHIGLPAAVIRGLPLQKIVWLIAGVTASATIILNILGSIFIVRMANTGVGYALLSCGNSLPYFHSCGIIWFLMRKEPKRKHWKSWCIWAFNFLAAVCVLVLICLLPLHQTQWFLPGQLIIIFASQIPWVLGASMNGIIKLKLEISEAQRLQSSAGSSKQNVLNIHKEEVPLTMLEMLAPKSHERPVSEHDMQSLNDDQEVSQAV